MPFFRSWPPRRRRAWPAAASLLALAAGVVVQGAREGKPGRVQGIGVKIGEVTQTSAIIWTRVPPPDETPVREGPDLLDLLLALFTEDDPQVRLRYGTQKDLSGAKWTEWQDAELDDDATHQFVLEGLRPHARYSFEVEATDKQGRPVYEPRRGTFRTAPPASIPAAVTFTVATCQRYGRRDVPGGFRIYDSMLALEPDFLVMTGDAVYYSRGKPRANTVELARERWRRMYQLPMLFRFHAQVPAYWQKDDHDLCGNECNPGRNYRRMGELDIEEGLKIHREQTPAPARPYRTVRWGRDLQIWLLEVREFRSSNRAPDGPGKTIWGREQKEWFQRTLTQSDATWRLFINPTPVVGPDRGRFKRDNHANAAWDYEGNWFRQWASETLGDNFFVIAGDRHWQYHSVHPETGVEEFGCGPASNAHAGGSPGYDKDYHLFHRVAGGFLSVEVRREGGERVLRLRHHAVDGEAVHESVKRRRVEGPADGS